jgi:hypothetical protein
MLVRESVIEGHVFKEGSDMCPVEVLDRFKAETGINEYGA